MNNLLITLPCCADDGPYAEHLLDSIYQLNGRSQHGHILLAYAHDLHSEMKMKLRICADLAFEGVTEFQATSRPIAFDSTNTANMRIELKTKVEFVNNLWLQTAHFVAGHYRWPWLWMEPDCVPIRPDWISQLAAGYANQPKKFMGRKMRRKVGENESFFLSRTAVYPTSAFAELRGFVGSPPFEWTSGNHTVPRSSTSRLIQETVYDGDINKVAREAVILHSDKSGKLIEQLREGKVSAPEHQNGEAVEVKVSEPTIGSLYVKRLTLDPVLDPEPPDKRTKEWKGWNARQKAAV